MTHSRSGTNPVPQEDPPAVTIDARTAATAPVSLIVAAVPASGDVVRYGCIEGA
jgi:hypothetical protein